MSFLDLLRGGSKTSNAPLFLYNTLGKERQLFSLPPGAKAVRMYNCGPTVYARQHIGNLSMFVFTDVLRRTLEYNGFQVKQTINITDFGHLTSDADEGEDKMLKGLKHERLKPTMENMHAMATKYMNIFMEDIRALNVTVDPVTFPRASEYVPGQIAMIQTLEEKGYAYVTDDGVYFDTSKFPRYGALGGIDLKGLKEGARVEAVSGKRNPTDFALWKFVSEGRSTAAKMGWDAPWGRGFPGWHIECSAMARATLGEQIDIHTGGIEHIPVHHNNEIAQSECATGRKPFSRFWLHRAHIQVDGGKLAKSTGTVIYLSDISERSFHPLALRYLFLGAHYRTSMNFTWESLGAAQKAYVKLLTLCGELKAAPVGAVSHYWKARFIEHINDDLDTPGALATAWEMIKDKHLEPGDLRATLLDFDRVFGLDLAEPDDTAKKLMSAQVPEYVVEEDIPQEVKDLMHRREEARAQKDYTRADALRSDIEDKGYTLEDSPTGPKLYKRG